MTNENKDHDMIRGFAALLDETGLTEIEYEKDGLRVRVARQATFVGAPAQSVMSAGPAAASAPVDPAKHPGMVASPMVGTAYRSPEPGAKPFVDIGSQVVAGETLLIIEAMKTMNQVPAPHAGRVTQILFDDGQPVEYGEPLIIVE